MVHTTYRGYAVIYNDLGIDIWKGEDYIETVSFLQDAWDHIDEWMEAR